MFGLARKKQVVLYSMDRNADAAVAASLRKTRGVHLRQVFTLDRAKVARMMLAEAQAPRHILTSDRILREELAGKKPFYFVTLVSEPHNLFATASEWLRHEYRKATGIDVQSFDSAQTSREYQLGPHKLLLLSARAPRDEQEKIISGFLGRKIAPIPAKQAVHAATLMSRGGAISAPMNLLKGLADPRAVKLHAMLAAQHRYLEEPFQFSPRAAPVYKPAPRRVMYNAHQSLPFHTSGYATRTQGLVHALRALEWNVQVVTRAGYPLDTRHKPELPANTIDSVPYLHDMRPDMGQWDAPLDRYIDQAAAYLCEWGKELRPGILHTASNFMCGLAGIEAARRLGIPSIYEMRGLWHITRWSKEALYDRSEKFALAQKLELEAADSADHVIAITGALKDWLVEHGIADGKISVAPNAVDLERFTPRPRDEAFARETGCDGKTVIGYIGSFVSYEGLDLLLDAVAAMPSRECVKVLWMGDGPMLAPWLQKASDLGLADQVVSLGRRPFEDVPRAYSIVDIAAFPRKGLPVCEIISPLKPFEAMAMEKPVVVSDVRPLREIVVPGATGFTHAKDDAADLAAQLEKLAGDAALRERCGKAGRAWVEDTRQWSRIASDIAKIYGDLS